MIVADVNLLVYLMVSGEFTETAERAYARDRRGIAPRSHRFELLNVLSTHVRAGDVALEQAEAAWRRAFRFVATPTEADPMDVLKLSVASRLATYDCEYIILARRRHLRVVTNDKAMLKAFTDVAASIRDFADGK